jgi:hypothetical protein
VLDGILLRLVAGRGSQPCDGLACGDSLDLKPMVSDCDTESPVGAPRTAEAGEGR